MNKGLMIGLIIASVGVAVFFLWKSKALEKIGISLNANPQSGADSLFSWLAPAEAQTAQTTGGSVNLPASTEGEAVLQPTDSLSADALAQKESISIEESAALLGIPPEYLAAAREYLEMTVPVGPDQEAALAKAASLRTAEQQLLSDKVAAAKLYAAIQAEEAGLSPEQSEEYQRAISIAAFRDTTVEEAVKALETMYSQVKSSEYSDQVQAFIDKYGAETPAPTAGYIGDSGATAATSQCSGGYCKLQEEPQRQTQVTTTKVTTSSAKTPASSPSYEERGGMSASEQMAATVAKYKGYI